VITLDKKEIYRIRKFNRFYTRILKLTDKYHLNTHFTILDSRILLEVDRDVNTANQLLQLLHLDKGYVSRVLKRLKDNDLLYEIRDEKDKRIKLLKLTDKGQEVLEDINERADDQIIQIFGKIPPQDIEKIIVDMKEIQNLINKYDI
jgi:Transcriptional regulators